MKSVHPSLTTIAACLLPLGFCALLQGDRPGYDDTPLLPGQEWRVHDRRRPRPAVVGPAREPGGAPSDAQVLFDRSGLERWSSGGGDARWDVEDGVLRVNGTGDIATRDHFGDLQLHVEWATPSVVEGESQGRGNSGVFLMGRYEIQVLDSFENESYADGQAAALYGQVPPAVNACRGPGEWQTYDIFWKAPRFDGETLAAPGVVTVVHNGVVVHHAREFIGASAHRSVATYAPHPPRGPIVLQDHGNPVRYRNIWVREL
jgi:hypothetical protein